MCVIVCDLGTTKMRLSMFDLDCGVTEKEVVYEDKRIVNNTHI